jgi:DNA-binding transcriptional MerR regulator
MSRRHSSRAAREGRASSGEVIIPDKLYFRIGDVSDLAETKPYVLRYWETEFPSLRPVKSRTGHRLYRREDVEMVFTIKRLLYEQGFTIEGARKHLAGNSKTDSAESSVPKHAAEAAFDTQQLKAIKREIQGILTVLSRKC